ASPICPAPPVAFVGLPLALEGCHPAWLGPCQARRKSRFWRAAEALLSPPGDASDIGGAVYFERVDGPGLDWPDFRFVRLDSLLLTSTVQINRRNLTYSNSCAS